MVDASRSTRHSDLDGARGGPATDDSGRGPRVLVVEPDPAVRERLRERLVGDLDEAVVATARGQTGALRWAARGRFDCLVVRYELSVATALDLLRWLDAGADGGTGAVILADDDGAVTLPADDLTLPVEAVLSTATALETDRLAGATRALYRRRRSPALPETAGGFFDGLGVGALLYGPDGEVVYWNDRAADSAPGDDDVDGLYAWDVLPPVTAEGFRDRWQQLEQGEVRVEETTVPLGRADRQPARLLTARLPGEPAHDLVLVVYEPGPSGGDLGFAETVSYELRTRLETARRALSVARDTGERYHLQRLERVLVRAEDLLASELEAHGDGLRVEDPAPQRLNAVARAAWDHVDTGGASLQVRSSATVLADHELLMRAFEHLFRNAVAHAAAPDRREGEGGDGPDHGDAGVGDDPTVFVGVTADGIAVEDDGPGIPPDIRDRVFDPAFSTTDRDGLGLAIVARIAAAHGWTATVTDGRLGGARVELDGVIFAAGENDR